MRLVAAAVLLAASLDGGTPMKPEARYFRWQRAISTEHGAGTMEHGTGEKGSRACAVLDSALYAHAAPSLADVRLFTQAGTGPDRVETPYALTVSETTLGTVPGDGTAAVTNLGLSTARAGRAHIVFDLKMPQRAYTNVDLTLRGQDFLASATVTGLRSLNAADAKTATSLGTFTLFDLTAQRLGRSTSLPLRESTFPYLHVDLAVGGASNASFAATTAMVEGAEVPPSREAQTLFTVVAETSTVVQRGRTSVASFTLPARIPVERVSFELAAGEGANFSRSVRVSARALGEGPGSSEEAASEEAAGEISRVKMTQAGQEIRLEALAFDATLGSNAQRDAKVEIAVENGDDRPLAIRAVRLEMRQRKLCFDVPLGSIEMFYGDAALEAPVYDYSRIFTPGDSVRVARLQAEQPNPEYVPRVQRRLGVMERHPEILWIALLGVMAVLAVLAFRSARHRGF